MKVVFKICLLAFLSLLDLQAHSQNFNWASSVFNTAASTSGSAVSTASAIDRLGNMYVAGKSVGPVQIGSQTINVADSVVRYSIIKYSAAGAILTVLPIITTASAFNDEFYISDIETDTSGNIYATGNFVDSITISGAGANAMLGFRDFFVAKWNTSGTLQWVTTGTGTGHKISRSLCTDMAGNVFISGDYNGISTFGQTTLPAFNFEALSFVVKLSPAGTILWAKGSVNSAGGSSRAYTIGADMAGNIYVQGSFSNSISWGNVSLTAALPGTGSATTYWVKLNTAGDVINGFAFTAPDPNNHPASMVVDQFGNSYLANGFANIIDLGGVTIDAIFSDAVFVAKYDPSGVLQWTNVLQKANTLTSFTSNNLALDQQNKLYLAGNFSGQINADNFFVGNAGNGFDAFAAAFDTYTGSAIWVLQSQNATLISGNRIAASQTGQVGITGVFLNGTAQFDSSTVSAPNLAFPSFYIARIGQSFNTISGKIFVDTNANSLLDAGEVPLQNTPVVVEVNQGAAAFTSSSTGNYYALTGDGTNTVTIPNPPPYYTVVSAPPAVVNFPGIGLIADGFNFALQPIANQQDLQVFVTQLMPVRPGFTATVRVTYKNIGTVPIPSGSVSLAFDPLLTYLSSQPAGTLTGSVVSWSYVNLLPGQSRNVNIVLSVPASATIGDTVNFTAGILPVTGDVTPADNSETIMPAVTASFDPNKMEVNMNAITPVQLQTGEWLYYTIHFQNLGTDTAFTVMLRDSLPVSQLNMGTIQMVAASHNHVWSISPVGIVNVVYNSIKLPHQGINSIGSHGFARFRIKPKTGLVVGEIIPNQAKIYFDYNPYIATNTATTEVKQPSGISAIARRGSWKAPSCRPAGPSRSDGVPVPP
ncbi:MAG: hypothetical protein EOP50_01825 [Sphingobacteriales bacterium]|nr:MAG: hypothetical protein EOP50_01825 [Sphingobacteriales bacterium]